jgi:serine protease AprX
VRHGFGKAVWGAALLLALGAPAAAESHRNTNQHSRKLDAALAARSAPDEGARSVIVSVKPGAKSGVRKRLEGHGDSVVRDHGVIDALTVRVDGRGLQALANDPDVESVSIDADVTPSAAPPSGDTAVVSDLKQKLAIGNWFSGSSVTIAVIDSGIAPLTDFSGRIVGSYDFTGAKGAVAVAPGDEFGHGTHVAGLAGSSGAISGGTFAGVAPGVKLLSLKVLTKKGSGKTSDVIAAVDFAVANRARFGIRVINLSLGHPIYESAVTDPLVKSVEAAVRAGIVVVVAAGNYGTNPTTGAVGYAGIASPGNAPSALTVGAANTGGTVERIDDRVASFSSRGPSWFDGYAKPDVVAPGTAVLSNAVEGSTLATSYPSLLYRTTGGTLLKLSGSSMATGVISGLVAVMIDAHDYGASERVNAALTPRLKKLPYVPPPDLTPNAIKAMLQYTATPLKNASGIKYDALTQGTGEANGMGAVTLAYTADTSRPAGTPWLTLSLLPQITLFGSDLQSWSRQIVWGTVVVRGGGLADVNQPAWQQTVVWGAGELDNIVWGTASSEEDNIVWGTTSILNDVVWAGSVMEGDNIVWGTALVQWGPNIVWGTSLLGVFEGDNIVWGTAAEGDNIVWGTMSESDNIVWGTLEYDNMVWGTSKKISGLPMGGLQ